MANQPFDRVVVNPRERPLSVDFNRAFSEADRSLRALWTRLVETQAAGDPFQAVPISGFFGTGFRVRASSVAEGGPNMNVRVSAGLGQQLLAADSPSAIGGVVGLDDLEGLKPLVLSADEVITVPANPDPNPRIDIVEVRAGRRTSDSQNRDLMDPALGTFSAVLVNKTLTWDLAGRSTINGAGEINYKAGIPAAAPVSPATTSGYLKVAEVYVAAAAVIVTQSVIADRRRLAYSHNEGVIGCRIAIDVGVAPKLVTTDQIAAPVGVAVIPITIVGSASGSLVDLYVVAGTLGVTPTAGGTGTDVGNDGFAAQVRCLRQQVSASLATVVPVGPLVGGKLNVAQAAALADPLRTTVPQSFFGTGVVGAGQPYLVQTLQFVTSAGAADAGPATAYAQLSWRSLP